jgi:hypothetical protein
MVCGNPVIGHVAGAGNNRVVENVETTTMCIRYFPSVLSCQAPSATPREANHPRRLSELLKGVRFQRRNGVTAEKPTSRPSNDRRVAQFSTVGGIVMGNYEENAKTP